MPSILESCKKYFKSNNLYEIFDLKKDSLEKDIKKAYYKLSLKVHPDRVPEEEKEIATEKFKVLTKLYQVLTDKNKKALYDDKGIVDDEDDENFSSWISFWSNLFKPITVKDIDDFKSEYIGSDLEKNDIKKSYLNGKGCINFMMNCVPFMDVENEPRIQKIVQEMIDSKEVPLYKIFTQEPTAKKNRRHKKYANEAKEAESIKKELEKNGSLEQQIMKRQSGRANGFTSFMDKLIEKYGNGEEDDSPAVDLKTLGKKRKNPTNSKVATKKSKPEQKIKEKAMPTRVSKRLAK